MADASDPSALQGEDVPQASALPPPPPPGVGTVEDVNLPEAHQYVAMANQLPPAAQAQPAQDLPPAQIVPATYMPEGGAVGGRISIPANAGMLPALPGANFGSGMGDIRRLEKQQGEHHEQAAADIKRVAEARGDAAKAEGEALQKIDKANFDATQHANQLRDIEDAQYAEKQSLVEGNKQKAWQAVSAAQERARSMTFDPDHFVRNLGAGQSALAAVSVILGGLGAALTGGPNQAMGIIQNKINQDIQKQKDDYDKARGAVDDANNMYAHFRQQGFDDAQAHAGAHLSINAMLQNQIQSTGAQYQGAKDMARQQSLLADLDANASEAANRLNSATDAQSAQVIGMKANARQFAASRSDAAFNQGLASAKLGEERAEFSAKQKQKEAEGAYTPEQRDRYVAGVGLATDKESAKILRTAHEAYINTSDALRTIIELKKEHPGPVFQKVEPKLYAQLQTATRTILNGQRVTQGLGTLQQNEYERLQSQIGDPTTTDYTSGTLEGMNELLRASDHSFNSSKTAYLDDTVPQGKGAAPNIIEKGDYGRAK